MSHPSKDLVKQHLACATRPTPATSRARLPKRGLRKPSLFEWRLANMRHGYSGEMDFPYSAGIELWQPMTRHLFESMRAAGEKDKHRSASPANPQDDRSVFAELSSKNLPCISIVSASMRLLNSVVSSVSLVFCCRSSTNCVVCCAAMI